MDASAIAAELEKAWLGSLPDGDQAEGRKLLAAIARDWARQLGIYDQPDQLLAELMTELERELRKPGPSGRIGKLRRIVFEQRAQRLSGRAFELGKGVVDGTMAGGEAQTLARVLYDEMRELRLAPEAEALDDLLSEAFMDLTYVLHGMAMSIRLSDYKKG